MLDFDKENKITYEQLSFSLQDKLRKVIPRQEINKVSDLLTAYEKALNNVRISYVNQLSDVTLPVNDADVAILNKNNAFELYVYTGNRWVKIPTLDIYYKLTINQSPNQTIYVNYKGNIYTSSLNIKYGDTWTATIESNSSFYRAGVLSKSSGTMEVDDSISATPATLIHDFVINAVIGKYQNGDDYGVRINWSGEIPDDELYGSMDPEMFDWLRIAKTDSGTYESTINFYGTGPTTDMYDYITMAVVYQQDGHYMLSNYPLSNFNATGDLYNAPTFTTEEFYNLFKSLKGKQVQILIHFD